MLKALSLAGLVVGAGVLYVVGVAVYNVFLHPLRKYPGPLLWRASRIPFCLSVDGGMIPHEVNRFHKKYGPVVRIAPDQLAYADAQAWKDVMGHHGSKKPEMARWDKYYRSVPGIGTHIINAGRADHSAMRKIFSHSFSEKAVRDQEPIIKEYINLFVQRLVENCDDGKATVEMSSYFNYLFFDVIGNLSYGEDFGCLNSDTSVPFVNAFFKGCRHAARLYALAYFPTLQKWELQRAAKDQDAIAEQVGFLREGILKLKKRMDSEETRPDLIQSLLDNREKLGLDVMSLETNASILIAAGSETTATTLSGLTYLLLTNRDALDQLTQVIRGRFKSEDEITFASCADIPYLKACVDEGLRMYPPTPAGLPRVTPPGGAQIAGEWVPEGTAVEFYQYAVGHAPFLWTEPDEYHPERWLDDPRFAADQREAFQPFHLGPRSCLGRHLATMELRSIIARLVWKFDMKLDESSRGWMDGQLVYDVWTRPALNVRLTPAKRI